MPGTEAPTHHRIQRLSPLVASQIAAGEVVERPASIVKELVENSIDAGATRIILELEQGGIELVRIIDDGGGIPEIDLPMAVAAHATSKIRSTADLDSIGTLGFRGEALASIASVSRLSIRSRTAHTDAAFMMDVEGENPTTTRPTSGPIGTTVSARNLFFNTPARRKFLRTVPTEQERCLDVFRAIALAHPAVGFHAEADARTLMDVPKDQSPRERVLSVLGKELAPRLFEVNADEFDDTRGVIIWGMAGHPEIARASNRSQHLFINGRCVRDRTIQHAVAEAYRGLIEPGRYPTIVLHIEMHPNAVDVNVHPAKAEVRFRDSGVVHSAVTRSIRKALAAQDLTPLLNFVRPTAPPTETLRLPLDLPGTGKPNAALHSTLPGSGSAFADFFTRPTPPPQQRFDYEAIKHTLENAPATDPAPVPMPLPEPAARVLQVHKSYLVTQDEQGVVIIDQHALHERAMFEYLLARVLDGGLETQHLLTPVPIPATARQVERLQDLAPLLARIGVQAEPGGPVSILLRGFPTFLFDRNVDPVEFLSGLFEKAESDAFMTDVASGSEEALRDVLDMMSCKAAIKAGDGMSDVELAALVRLRDDVERSSNCPHGRPTSVRLTIRELEKLFHRA